MWKALQPYRWKEVEHKETTFLVKKPQRRSSLIPQTALRWHLKESIVFAPFVNLRRCKNVR